MRNRKSRHSKKMAFWRILLLVPQQKNPDLLTQEGLILEQRAEHIRDTGMQGSVRLYQSSLFLFLLFSNTTTHHFLQGWYIGQHRKLRKAELLWSKQPVCEKGSALPQEPETLQHRGFSGPRCPTMETLEENVAVCMKIGNAPKTQARLSKSFVICVNGLLSSM